MKFDILTIFSDIIYSYAGESILKRAQKAGLIKIAAYNFRDYTKDKQRHVDDRPFGGGAGMVLQIQPIYDCLKAIKALKHNNTTTQQHKKLKIKNSKIIIMDPAGKKFDQAMAKKFSKLDRIVLICGRYEGFDERVYKLADEKISMGDYVLSGGELPALAVVEAVARLIPGVLGNEESLLNETFSKATQQHINTKTQKRKGAAVLECSGVAVKKWPQYTRPKDFMGWKVPKVLLSGNHKKIQEWRNKHTINPN